MVKLLFIVSKSLLGLFDWVPGLLPPVVVRLLDVLLSFINLFFLFRRDTILLRGLHLLKQVVGVEAEIRATRIRLSRSLLRLRLRILLCRARAGQLLSSFVIGLPFNFILQDSISFIDSLEFVLVHATGFIWMILKAELVILHLNRILVYFSVYLHGFIVILLHIEIIGIRAFLLTAPEHTSRTLGQR